MLLLHAQRYLDLPLVRFRRGWGGLAERQQLVVAQMQGWQVVRSPELSRRGCARVVSIKGVIHRCEADLLLGLHGALTADEWACFWVLTVRLAHLPAEGYGRFVCCALEVRRLNGVPSLISLSRQDSNSRFRYLCWLCRYFNGS